MSARGVPYDKVDSFSGGIFRKVLYTVATDIGVPPVVDKYIFISHIGREIYVGLLVFKIDAAVLPYNPAPCAATGLCFPGCLVAGFDKIPRYCSLYNRGKVVGDGHGAPRGIVGQAYAGRRRSVAVVFAGHGVCYSVQPVVEIAKMTAAEIPVDIGFGQKNPCTFRSVEQSRECEAVTIFRLGAERRVDEVKLLVAWFCAFPSYHRVAL